MKVLGISTSPRKGGNTEILIAEALQGALSKGAEIEFVTLAGKDIRPCLAHAECGKGASCLVHDDLIAVQEKMAAADAIIFGTPIYFGSMCSQAKILIDRTYYLAKSGRKLENKVGGVIAVGGRAGHEFTTATIMDFMTLQGIALPPKAFAHALVRDLGAAKQDEKALKEAFALGERVAGMALKLKS
ncbi:MAG: flavodoxin family protein [Methanomassiliicoccales archaeon]